MDKLAGEPLNGCDRPANGNLDGVLARAVAEHRAGRREAAERHYRVVLESRPSHPEANHNLGMLALDRGAFDLALPHLKRALEEEPGRRVFWLGLLEGLIRAGYRDAARRLVEEGRRRGLRGPDVDRLAAIAEDDRTMSMPSDERGVLERCGDLAARGSLVEAEAELRQLIKRNPASAEARCNLASILRGSGRLGEAERFLREALALHPDFPEALSNLGNTLRDLRRPVEAEALFRRAIALRPDFANAHFNLGVALRTLNRLTEAEASYRRALELQPHFIEALSNLGAALQEQGRLADAEAFCRQSIALKPGFSGSYDALLFTLNYDPDKSAEEIFSAYRDYDARFGRVHRGAWLPHANSREVRRRLRVGYVSPDFRQHAVTCFLEPLLAHHDKSAVEVFAYAELRHEDAVTARYRAHVDRWVPTLGLPDAALAERIRADGIDILVDLAGHTTDNRLGVFARKPAPVSLSWLGYGYTTGLSAIDYLLTDDASAPEGSDALFSEKPWRLAAPCYAFRPTAGMGAVSPLPALQRGWVTYCTLSRAVRINSRTIQLWAEILRRAPGARLAVDSNSYVDPAVRDALAERFAQHGIGAERLRIGYHSPPWEVLRGADIGLDCFPHNSGTTLFETLYMGLPFVSLAGRPSVGRLGCTILEALGHPEWIATSEESYVEKAVALAGDLPGLARLRTGLRGEMRASPLMDEAGFARKVEAAYREMFARWVASQMEGQANQ